MIFDSGVRSFSASDPQQTGRISRDGVPSDWSVPKAFPGVIQTTSSFTYESFLIPNITLPYIQIESFDVNNTGSPFASAYLNSYQPNSAAMPNLGLDVNYLGDAGLSGNQFGNPQAFQVIVPVGSNLVVVVNSTATLPNQSFEFRVEQFADTSFGSAPEPSTLGLWLLSSVVAAAVARKANS